MINGELIRMNKKLIYGTLFILFLSLLTKINAQTNVLDSLECQSYQRIYLTHLPPNYTESASIPLVIFLHGGGGNAQSAQRFTMFNQVANAKGFVVVYPQAYFEGRPNSYVWADGRNTAADKAGIDDVGFITKMVGTIISEYSINENKIYLCGFSNGSFLAQSIAFQANQYFAAMATIGGTMDTLLFNSGNPGRAIPMTYIFGTQDPFVPYDGGVVAESATMPVVGIEQAVQFWVENNQCLAEPDSIDLPNINTSDNSTVTLFEYKGGAAPVKFFRINGGGHTWPGVELARQEALLGETNEDISASLELWNFFNKYSLNTTAVLNEKTQISNFELFPNYPNPFNPTTMISYQLTCNSDVELALYNVLGEKLMTLVNEYQMVGNHKVELNLSHLPSGTYFYSLSADKFIETKKMVLLK